jgi:antitoxin (DNA-binding transcriptional repressor) of toxin-antitoxin stability system
MSTITIEEAQARLPELIDGMIPGEEWIIVRNAQPIARLVSEATVPPRPIFGRGRGKVVVRADDDEHLKDFEDYMR